MLEASSTQKYKLGKKMGNSTRTYYCEKVRGIFDQWGDRENDQLVVKFVKSEEEFKVLHVISQQKLFENHEVIDWGYLPVSLKFIVTKLRDGEGPTFEDAIPLMTWDDILKASLDI